jgi:hypothetical protein
MEAIAIAGAVAHHVTAQPKERGHRLRLEVLFKHEEGNGGCVDSQPEQV